MDRLELVTRWIWRPGNLVCRILEIRGGAMDDRVRSQLQHSSPPNLRVASKQWSLAKKIVDFLGSQLPTPEPLDVGSPGEYEGVVTGIQLVDARPSDKDGQIYMSYYVSYANGVKSEGSDQWQVDTLPPIIRTMVRDLHREVNLHVNEWFAESYGGGQIDLDKWKAEKTEVFISYRESGSDKADLIFYALGEYQDRTIFVPRIDHIDMQAGNWLDQLIAMIKRCEVFMPVFSKDYLEGPIARPELDQALRLHYSDDSRLIVPVLIQGARSDYKGHFLGGFHIVDALGEIDDDKIDEIARLALRISRSPYN